MPLKGNPAAAILFNLVIATCAPATQQPARAPAGRATVDAGAKSYTAADVSFMQGMIHHHAQALVMAALAPSHGASDDVRVLASRIDVGQRDEIGFMQRWLRERNEMVPGITPAADTTHHHVSMPGMQMSSGDTLMPGMLTPQQMAQLSAANGAEFDRLFLTFMIQHHRGALTMVDRLYANQGAGQDLYVFRFTSDVTVDQTTEIERMRGMLAARPSNRDQP